MLSPGAWIEDFLQLHQQIAALIRKRMLRDPYGLERLVESEPEED